MKTTLDELFASDENKSENGVPITVGINSKNEDVIFIVAEAGNNLHQKTQRKYARQLERARKNAKLHRKLMAKIVAQSLLRNWHGVLDKSGEEVEPTYENKLEALLTYQKLYLTVMEAATDETNYLEDGEDPDAEKETEKN